MADVPNGRSGLSVDTVDAQLTEKRIAMSVTDWMTNLNQLFPNFPAAPLWAFDMDVIDEFHEI